MSLEMIVLQSLEQRRCGRTLQGAANCRPLRSSPLSWMWGRQLKAQTWCSLQLRQRQDVSAVNLVRSFTEFQRHNDQKWRSDIDDVVQESKSDQCAKHETREDESKSMESRIFADPGSEWVNAWNVGCQSGCETNPKHQSIFDPRGNLDNATRRHRMDRELHRAHGQSEHRKRACEDPLILHWDDTTQQGNHAAEFFVQLCMQHWTTPRSKRHAGSWTETDSPNERHLNTVYRSGAWNHFVQRVFASQDVGLVSRWQTVERFVEPCSLFVSSTLRSDFHRPRSFIFFRVRVPRAASMDGPLCRAMYGTNGTDTRWGFRLDKNRFRGARIAPSFPSFNEQTIKKGCLRNHVTRAGTRHVVWKQLLSLAIHLTWNLIWCQRQRDVKVRIGTNSLKNPSASAFKGKGTRHAVGETKEHVHF